MTEKTPAAEPLGACERTAPVPAPCETVRALAGGGEGR